MNSGKIPIGPFLLDLSSNSLETATGDVIHLTNKSAQVLYELASNAGKLVTREYLIDTVWHGNFIVGSTRLNDEIWKVRRTLDHAGASGIFIKTIPREGYCLLVSEECGQWSVADSTLSETLVAAGTALLQNPPRPRALLISLLSVLMLSGSVFTRTTGPGHPSPVMQALSSSFETSQMGGADPVRFFLDLLDLSDAPISLGQLKVLNRMLEDAQRNVAGFSDDPAVQARLLAGIGEIYLSVHNFRRAQELINESMAIEAGIFGTDSYEHLRSHIRQAKVFRVSGKARKARDLYTRVLAEIENHDYAGTDLAGVYNGLGILDWRAGDFTGAEQNYLSALEHGRTPGTGPDENVAESMDNLGLLYHGTGRLDEALDLYQQAHAMRVELFGFTRRADVGKSLNNRADLLMLMGEFEAARTSASNALDAYRKYYGVNHFGNGIANVTMAKIVLLQGELDLAEDLLDEGVRILNMQSPGLSKIYLAGASLVTGDLLIEKGLEEHAARYYRNGIEGYQALLGPDHPETRTALSRYGRYASAN